MINTADERLLRRAIGIAAHAVTVGEAPYGSLLAGPGGAILAEAHNTVRRDNDITAHPELKLARWAARELTPEVAARTTMYTSCQPCGMCTGGIVRSGLGRVGPDPEGVTLLEQVSGEQLAACSAATTSGTSGAPGLHQSRPFVSNTTR